MRINSKTAFFLSLFFLLVGPIFFPKLHTLYLAPYLVISLYQHSKFGVLWRALFCGILLDLLSSGPFFGFSALEFCFVSWLLQSQTRNFFVDKLSTLPLMSYLFTLLSTGFSYIFNIFFNDAAAPTLFWVFSDLICMPLIEAFYALLVFSLPFELIYLFKKLRLARKR